MAIPSLSGLPIELQREIISNLELQDRARLSVTCRRLASNITPPTFEEFLAAEILPWAVSKQFYACSGCARLRHLLQFADDMRKGRRGRNGVDARTRLCVRCGVEQQLYAVGMEVTIMGQLYVCEVSHDITDIGGTPYSFPGFKLVPRTRRASDIETRHQNSEDDWPHETRSYTRNGHSEEIDGPWLGV